MMIDYSSLFQPGKIGSVELGNRIIMPAMASQLSEPDGRLSKRLLDYYLARASGGVGMIIPAYAAVSDDSPLMFNMAIYDDEWIDEWRKLVDAIHQYGVKVGIQLMHVGMLYLFAGFVPKGTTMKVASETPWLREDMPHQVLTIPEIERYVDDFSQAARRASEAGADMVEIHSCHGSLAGMFMSPITNQRTDDYGGSVEKRSRFPCEVIERIRERVGPDLPIIMRINGSDDLEGGTTPEEAARQAAILESAGANAISVSRGIEFWATTTIPSYLYPPGSMLPLVDEIKKLVDIPVIAAGRIDAELASEVIEQERADFVAMGRPLLADPQLPNKLRQNRPDDIRRCIYCMNCLNQDRRKGRGSCSVNPFLNRESRLPMSPANPRKKVLVAGGGLAGMHTAVLLAERGHNVSIYERESILGGQWNTASAVPGKNHFSTIIDQLERTLRNLSVEINTEFEVTRDMVIRLEPDVVVVASGANPATLNVPGATGKNVIQGIDVLSGKIQPKGETAVIGGRYTAIDVAILLAKKLDSVRLVTRASLGLTMERMTFRTLLNELVSLRVPLYLNTTVLEITEKSVIALFNEELIRIPADTVVMAVGMQPENTLVQQLEGSGLDFHTVGDCTKPRNAAAAAYQAAQLATRI
ncbi:MAG: FAD-dependent oxidoreductase [Dehalococcoidia bacterium]